MPARHRRFKKKIRKMDVFKLCLVVSILIHGIAYGSYYIYNLPKFSGDDTVYDAKDFKAVNADMDFIDLPSPGLLGGDSNPAPVKKEEWIDGTGKNAPDAINTDVDINRMSGSGTDPDGYLSADFGDHAPIPIVDFNLNRYFPTAARSANITRKTVVVHLQINDDGSVQSFKIITPPAGYGFDEAAKKVIKKIRFKPGYTGGRPVKMFLNLPITFVLED